MTETEETLASLMVRHARSRLAETKPLTPKGADTAARLLGAATTVLARDGFGAATLGRIGELAGVDKRNILYYYPSREVLLTRVVQTVGEHVAESIGVAGEIAENPERLADTTVDALWSGVTSVPELARAYFALIGGSAGLPVIHESLASLKQAFLVATADLLDSIDGARWRTRGDSVDTVNFTLAVIRGILLEWTETGDTPAIEESLKRLKRAVAADFVPIGG